MVLENCCLKVHACALTTSDFQFPVPYFCFFPSDEQFSGFINPFHVTGIFLYLLKISQNL